MNIVLYQLAIFNNGRFELLSAKGKLFVLQAKRKKYLVILGVGAQDNLCSNLCSNLGAFQQDGPS